MEALLHAALKPNLLAQRSRRPPCLLPHSSAQRSVQKSSHLPLADLPILPAPCLSSLHPWPMWVPSLASGHFFHLSPAYHCSLPTNNNQGLDLLSEFLYYHVFQRSPSVSTLTPAHTISHPRGPAVHQCKSQGVQSQPRRHTANWMDCSGGGCFLQSEEPEAPEMKP